MSNSKITLINGSCADQEVDVVVNAANGGLWAGGGICGVIFKKAGMRELTDACNKHQTPVKDGGAVITPAFNMINAKAIIHAVGPDFGRTPSAFKELFEAYYNSLLKLRTYFLPMHLENSIPGSYSVVKVSLLCCLKL